MLRPKVGGAPLYAGDGLFDPLAHLQSQGAVVSLVAGVIRVLFESHVRGDRRTKLSALAARYDALLKLQLDVPAGERPRTVQQLVAAGRVLLRGGKYVRP